MFVLFCLCCRSTVLLCSVCVVFCLCCVVVAVLCSVCVLCCFVFVLFCLRCLLFMLSYVCVDQKSKMFVKILIQIHVLIQLYFFTNILTFFTNVLTFLLRYTHFFTNVLAFFRIGTSIYFTPQVKIRGSYYKKMRG